MNIIYMVLNIATFLKLNLEVFFDHRLLVDIVLNLQKHICRKTALTCLLH